MPFLKHIPKNDVIQLINNSCLLYENIKEQHYDTDVSQLLYDVRESVWSYLRSQCMSLLPMNCHAQFSEIFQLKNFGVMNDYEKSYL